MMAEKYQDVGYSLRQLLLGICRIDGDIDISMITLDARKIRAGGLFVAVAGSKQHGMQHAEQAINKGAAAIVYDPASGGELLAKKAALSGVYVVALEDLASKVSEIAARFYNYPSARMSVVGITGTNGKTSVSHFLAQALSCQQPCGVIGTLGWGVVKELNSTINTTPDAVSIQAHLASLLDDDGVASVAMEVSSHGLDQGRVNAVAFDGAVFTNLTQDHLDYHGSMTAYGEAKLALFKYETLSFAVVNLDDEFSSTICREIKPTVKLYGYSRQQAMNTRVNDCIQIFDERTTISGLSFSLNYQGQTFDVRSSLMGAFNIDNIVATLAVLLAKGWEMPAAITAIEQLQNVPGRMECISVNERLPLVVVDFAHTADALAAVLKSIREHCDGKLHVVFGCGGNRDEGKRPLMGAVANQLADSIVVTNDNPRDEAPEKIVESILQGIDKPTDVQVIYDRKLAIENAIQSANAADIVVVAGKGHENYQIVADKKIPFNDVAIVRSALHAKLQEVSS